MEQHGSETFFVLGEGLLGETGGGREPKLATAAAAPAFRFSRMGPKGGRGQLAPANLRKLANAMTAGGGRDSRVPAGVRRPGPITGPSAWSISCSSRSRARRHSSRRWDEGPVAKAQRHPMYPLIGQIVPLITALPRRRR
jgi:hypothetical protein